VLLGCLLFVAGPGCTPRVVLEPEQVSEELDPSRIAVHHQRLNAPELAGRGTATVGYATAAAYVAERLAGFGIQPVHPKEYRQVSFGPINHVSGTVVTRLGADSTRWGPDASMLADPRSASTRVEVTAFTRLSGDLVPPAGNVAKTAAVIDAVPSDAQALSIAQQGYAVLVVVGTPALGRATTRLPIGVLQVTPQRWERMSGGTTAGLSEGPLSLRIRIETSFDPVAPYINVIGILPGSNPVGRDRAVVLGASLDAASNPSGTAMVDPAGSGIGAAALLEVARLLSARADQGNGLSHSIVFVWFAGGAQRNAGLRDFLRSPPWSLQGIEEVVYVGRTEPARTSAALSALKITRLGPDSVLSSPTPTPVADQGRVLATKFLTAARMAR
jgi:hypothetical protein